MCTCGIDMATQHAMPATMRSTCRRAGETRDRLVSAAVTGAATGPRETGEGRRSARIKGSIVRVVTRPTPTRVGRHPCVAVKCWRIGGQTAPAR